MFTSAPAPPTPEAPPPPLPPVSVALTVAQPGGGDQGTPRVPPLTTVTTPTGQGVPEGDGLLEGVTVGVSVALGVGVRVALGVGVSVALGVAVQVGARLRPVVAQPPQGQGVGAPLPAGQKLPMGQMKAIEPQDPAGQK